MPPKPCSEAEPDWPLPERPHVPGETARPDPDDPVHRLARAAPDPTDPQAWRANPAWMAGLRLYAHGYFWEAHEVWEAVWANARANSAERALVQGVIQLANAGLKQRMRRPGAARRLAAMAAGHVDDAASGGRAASMGLDLLALRAAIAGYRAALADNDAAPVPGLSSCGGS